MIARLKAQGIGLLIGGLTLTAAFFYWQHVTGELDAYRAEAERQRDRAEILLENQQYQRQQIRTLNESLAVRDRALSIITTDISARKAALEQLGERDEEARDWLNSGLPGSVADWVRQLQTGDPYADKPVPDRAGAPY